MLKGCVVGTKKRVLTLRKVSCADGLSGGLEQRGAAALPLRQMSGLWGFV